METHRLKTFKRSKELWALNSHSFQKLFFDFKLLFWLIENCFFFFSLTCCVFTDYFTLVLYILFMDGVLTGREPVHSLNCVWWTCLCARGRVVDMLYVQPHTGSGLISGLSVHPGQVCCVYSTFGSSSPWPRSAFSLQSIHNRSNFDSTLELERLCWGMKSSPDCTLTQQQ